MCATHPDETFSPSPLVDIGWHIFILHTREYTEFCDGLAGHYIHHTRTTTPRSISQRRIVGRAGRAMLMSAGWSRV